jgi:hypothetical protein
MYVPTSRRYVHKLVLCVPKVCGIHIGPLLNLTAQQERSTQPWSVACCAWDALELGRAVLGNVRVNHTAQMETGGRSSKTNRRSAPANREASTSC